ncbi:transmembrane protein [Cystoisospora suis]|uniref:Transmembrane protein n=1 Tax=Cystoisospora suis TaxID=483139 RepID=A0A2C6LBA9_9APIC|nr:transmembrane protein [Cystoisospora suis]
MLSPASPESPLSPRDSDGGSEEFRCYYLDVAFDYPPENGCSSDQATDPVFTRVPPDKRDKCTGADGVRKCSRVSEIPYVVTGFPVASPDTVAPKARGRGCSRGTSEEEPTYQCNSVFGVYSTRVLVSACIFLTSCVLQFLLLYLAGTISSFQSPLESGGSSGTDSQRARHPSILARHSSTICNILYNVFFLGSVIRLLFMTPGVASAVIIRYLICVSIALLFRGSWALVSALTGEIGPFREGLHRHALWMLLDSVGFWATTDTSVSLSAVSSQMLIAWILVSFWGYYTSKQRVLVYLIIPVFVSGLTGLRVAASGQFISETAATLFVSGICTMYHLLLDIGVQRYIRIQSFSPSAGCVTAFSARNPVGDVLIQALASLEALKLRLECVLCSPSPAIVTHMKLSADPSNGVAEEIMSQQITREDLASRVILAYAGSGDFDATNWRALVKSLRRRRPERDEDIGAIATECEMEVFANVGSHARMSNGAEAP